MPSLEQLYQQVILDHTRAHHGLGAIKSVDASNHQVNLTCGDEVTLGIQSAPNGAIERIAWNGDGCSISQASLSMLAESVNERPGTDKVAKAYGAMEQVVYSRDRGVPGEVLDLLGDTAALESTSQFANRVRYTLPGWYALRDAFAKLGIDVTEDRV